ncbi:putative uncharacterized protein C8orf89 homolog [Candoia aspera]|uniref:putative uncharacterized protein C8orf89 homolog n=1 Tax=Candoia aspera TaxID=51853 RepID=UPI002FD7ADE0
MPDNTFLDNKGKLFESQPFMNSSKNAVLKTKRIKQDCVSAYGLSDSIENTAMPRLSQGMEKCPAIPNPFPVVQKTQSGANQFPNSSDSNKDSRLPPLHLLPSTLPQRIFEGYYKSRGNIAARNTDRKGMPWIKAPLKNSELHCGSGELGAVRLKKYNRCSSLISFPEGSKFRTGYRFPDPVIGAPPQFLQRLAELAALEHETIHQEKSSKIRKTKKQET